MNDELRELVEKFAHHTIGSDESNDAKIANRHAAQIDVAFDKRV